MKSCLKPLLGLALAGLAAMAGAQSPPPPPPASAPTVAAPGQAQQPPPTVSASARRLYERSKGQLLQIRTLLKTQDSQASVGSGFLVSDDGHVLTNYHVISQFALEPDSYRLRLRDDGRPGRRAGAAGLRRPPRPGAAACRGRRQGRRLEGARRPGLSPAEPAAGQGRAHLLDGQPARRGLLPSSRATTTAWSSAALTRSSTTPAVSTPA